MPKIVDHDERRRQIIDVARNLIIGGGFRAATMRSLAADAGYANGALKHYFDSKEQIIEATFDSVLDQISTIEAGQKPHGGTSLDRLRWHMMGPIPTSPQDFSAGRVLLALWDYALDSPRLLARYRLHLDTWRSRLVADMAAAHRDGLIRGDVDYAMVADGYISMVIGAAVMHLMYPNGEKVPVYTDFVERSIEMLQSSPAAVSRAVS